MCGLVTLISKKQWGFANKDVEAFEELLTVDQLRGQDATGAFCVHRNKQVSGIKLAATPWHLFKQPEYNTFRNKAGSTGRILVGHNRKATQGAATNPANAHPFQENNIILVHNGSLYNRQGLPTRDVDSHAVAAAFAEGEYDEVLKDINGAYAFIWWDMKRNQLSVVRNKDRPLWKLENKDVIVLCSEAWMGLGVMRRNSIGTTKGEEFDIAEVPVGVVHHYAIGGKLEAEEAVKKAPVQSSKAATIVTTPVTPHGSQVKATVPAIHTPTKAQEVTSNNVSQFPFSKEPPPFRTGERILVQINTCRTIDVAGQTTFNAIGVTVEPGKPIVDCVGILPSYVEHDAIERWQGNPVSAEVTEVRSSIRGWSVSLKHFSMVPLVETWPHGVITHQEWDYIVEKCGCKKCNAAIGEYEPTYTSVRRVVDNDKRKYEVTCADCIEEQINDKEVKNKFTEGRIDALQKWEQIGLRLSKESVGASRVQGNSTTH